MGNDGAFLADLPHMYGFQSQVERLEVIFNETGHFSGLLLNCPDDRANGAIKSIFNKKNPILNLNDTKEEEEKTLFSQDLEYPQLFF